MTNIVNLTQHPATPEQDAAGVRDLPADVRRDLHDLLMFGTLPGEAEIRERAVSIAALAARNSAATSAMLGGALWLMAPLALALQGRGITPLFAFSLRDTAEVQQPDGSVKKITTFRHAGFVPAVL